MTPLKFYERRERALKAITAAGLENIQLSSSDALDKLTVAIFPLMKLNSDLIKGSLTRYWNQILTPNLINEIVEWMIGGRDWIEQNNKPLVKIALPLSKPEACELQILSWRISKFNGLKFVVYRYKVMSGRYTGFEFDQKISFRYLPVVAKKLAFSKKNLWKNHPAELVRMWLSTVLENDRTGRRVVYGDITVDSSLRRYNVMISKERAAPCCYKLPWTCTECPVGYDKCFRGVHPNTYPKAMCSNTAKDTRGITSLKVFHSGYFEPGSKDGECIKCRFLKRRKRQKLVV